MPSSKIIFNPRTTTNLNSRYSDNNLCDLATKAIGFHVNMFVRCFTFPMWLTYCFLMLLLDPFCLARWAKKRATEKLLSIWGRFSYILICFISNRLNGQKSIVKLAVKVCWGLFWSVYVYFVLVGVLVSGFVVGGVVMRYIVEEPVQIAQDLNFDYTYSSPVAFVPIMSTCPSGSSSLSCRANCKENAQLSRNPSNIPLNHKFQLLVLLALPESDYNRMLGVFQVKVDHLAASGKVISSSTYPCMLQFKSELLRHLETLLKSLSLLAGYSTQSQLIHVKIAKGLTTEKDEPASCIKVTIERRAEYSAGGGVPEIYAASLLLDSELPLIKRVVWLWRKTIFVWTSIASFVLETIFIILVCCRPMFVPRTGRSSHGSEAKRSALGYAALRLPWLRPEGS